MAKVFYVDPAIATGAAASADVLVPNLDPDLTAFTNRYWIGFNGGLSFKFFIDGPQLKYLLKKTGLVAVHVKNADNPANLKVEWVPFEKGSASNKTKGPKNDSYYVLDQAFYDTLSNKYGLSFNALGAQIGKGVSGVIYIFLIPFFCDFSAVQGGDSGGAGAGAKIPTPGS